MILECWTGVLHIWGELLGPFIIYSRKGPVRSLPDDVTIEILSRLPADCVIKCRRVCRKWHELTSSPSFAELHLKRANSPSLFLHWVDCPESSKRGELNFFIYDKAGLKANGRRIVTKVRSRYGHRMFQYGPRVLGSCDGLIMFLTIAGPYNKAFVFNPITQELITVPAPFCMFAPCGIYRHPKTREYKFLLSAYDESPVVQYYTCSLKTMVFEKLKYSSTCTTRALLPAIQMNGSLHWMVKRNEIIINDNNNDCTDAIMVFSTETEDFRVLPHPGDKSCYNREEVHFSMHLLGMRGHLCLCLVLSGEIQVWVLEDCAGWAWDRRYKVSLNWNLWRFPFEYAPYYDPITVRILGIHNGVELLISWCARGMFLYNLEHNTVTKVAFKVDGPFYFPYICAVAYTKTLVCLNLLVSKKLRPLHQLG